MANQAQQHTLLHGSIKKIALQTIWSLGDILLSVPIFRAIRHTWPTAEIALISRERARGVVERFSHYIDRFVPLPEVFAPLPEPEQIGTAEDIVDYFRAMRRERFDLVLQLYPELFPGEDVQLQRFIDFARMLGARHTVGFVGSNLEGHHKLDFYLPYCRDRYLIDLHLSLLESLGIPHQGRDLEFPLSETELWDAQRLLENMDATSDLLIGIHPGASLPGRRWPAKRFAAVADSLYQRYGAKIVLTGTSGEQAVVEEVYGHMRYQDHVLNLVGQTPLGVLGALIARLDLLIANNTGPYHIALALQRPCVVIADEEHVLHWTCPDRHLQRVVSAPIPPILLERSLLERYSLTESWVQGVTVKQVLDEADALLARPTLRLRIVCRQLLYSDEMTQKPNV